MKHFFSIIILLILLPIFYIYSSTIIVDLNGAGDYTTIQEGIDNSQDDDIILVYPGTYYENIDYSGKNITVASKYYTTGDESYIDSTIIDGNNNGTCVTLDSGESDADIIGFTITNGSGYHISTHDFFAGGGLYLSSVSVDLSHLKLENNKADYGGGICVYSSPSNTLSFTGVNIIHNSAQIGGGLYFSGEGNVSFSEIESCNLYLNYASYGSDIYTQLGTLHVIVDTFTVQESNKFYATAPDSGFYQGEVTVTNINHKIEQINQDIYVSPNGNNANSGLNWNDALKNIYYALIVIKSDSTHPNTIYVDEGTYSPSLTSEFFALGGKEYISIIGSVKELTILDAEQTSTIISIVNINHFYIGNMQLYNGEYYNVGGIRIRESNVMLERLCLGGNIITGYLATNMLIDNNSNPVLKNITIKSIDESVNGVSIKCGNNSNPMLIKSSIENNNTNPISAHFGALVSTTECYPLLINCEIINNYGDVASGIRQSNASNDYLYLINCTIYDNKDCSEGTISLVDGGHVKLINTILRNDPNTEIWFHPQHEPNSASVEYCNIEGGIDAINTNNNGTLYWGDGNIDEDPLFVGGDPFSYELIPQSPCVDAGTPDTTGLHLPATDLAGNPRIFNGRIDIGAYECQDTVSVDEPDTSFIHNLYLFQNTPNPFNNETEILFITADYERVGDYSLSIYNTRGQLVRRFDGNTHEFWVKTKIVWDGTDEQGRQVAPGTYLYKLEYNGHAVVRKMTLLR